MSIPKDPIILLSYLNTKLRDSDISFTDLCKVMDIHPQEILAAMEAIDYHYDQKQNRFL